MWDHQRSECHLPKIHPPRRSSRLTDVLPHAWDPTDLRRPALPDVRQTHHGVGLGSNLVPGKSLDGVETNDISSVGSSLSCWCNAFSSSCRIRPNLGLMSFQALHESFCYFQHFKSSPLPNTKHSHPNKNTSDLPLLWYKICLSFCKIATIC